MLHDIDIHAFYSSKYSPIDFHIALYRITYQSFSVSHVLVVALVKRVSASARSPGSGSVEDRVEEEGGLPIVHSLAQPRPHRVHRVVEGRVRIRGVVDFLV